MKIIEYRKLGLLIIIAWCSTATYCQRAIGYINSSPHTGTAMIHLPPKFRSMSRIELKDIRIYNSLGQSVPYKIYTYTPNYLITDSLVPTRFKVKFEKLFSNIIIENPSQSSYSSFVITTNRSNVQKKAMIMGSNTKTDWYAISSYIDLMPTNNDDGVSMDVMITFPESDYKYFTIAINDSTTYPLEIKNVRVIMSKTRISNDRWDTVKHFKFNKQLPKTPISEWPLYLEQKSQIDAFEIKCKTQQYYRYLQLDVVNHYRHKRKSLIARQTVFNSAINQVTKYPISINQVITDSMIMKINNYDDYPLEISDILLYQRPTYLIADIKQGERYTVKIGVDSLKEPIYDYKPNPNFGYNLDSAIRFDVIEYENTVGDKYRKAEDRSKWFLWISIIIVALLLLYFSIHLLFEPKKSETNE